MLDRLMRGEPADTPELLVPPDHVVARQSTDTVFADDELTLHAVRYIQANQGRPFNVQEVSDKLSISKRLLELRFRKYFDCSPHEFLTRLRIERATELVRRGGLSQREVAETCGFGDVRNMVKAMQREPGVRR